ncbi:hypothetical protein As57867_004373, partial [Aphanomyces stellatus]
METQAPSPTTEAARLGTWSRLVLGAIFIGDQSFCRLVVYHALSYVVNQLSFFVAVVLIVAVVVVTAVVTVALGLELFLRSMMQWSWWRTRGHDRWRAAARMGSRWTVAVTMFFVKLDMRLRNIYDRRRYVDPSTASGDAIRAHAIPLALYFFLWTGVCSILYNLYLGLYVWLPFDEMPSWEIVFVVLLHVVILYVLAWIMGGVTQGIIVPVFVTSPSSSSQPKDVESDDDQYHHRPIETPTSDKTIDIELYCIAVPLAPFVQSAVSHATAVDVEEDASQHERLPLITTKATTQNQTHRLGLSQLSSHQADQEQSLFVLHTPSASDIDGLVDPIERHVDWRPPLQHGYDMANDLFVLPSPDTITSSPRPYETMSPLAHHSPRSSSDYGVLSPRESAPQRSSHRGFETHPVFRSTKIEPDDKQDAVHFLAYAPPTVAVEMDFSFAIWAFLVHQREDMHDQATAESSATRQLSREVLLSMRRGAMAHVRLEVPDGFEVLDDPVKAFSWTGDITSVKYHVQCTSSAPPGQVLFQATIVVGAKVMTLKSYVFVSPTAMALESEMAELSCELEMLPETFEEIPYHDLDFKELVGRGNFGDAYRAEYNGKDVVVKTIRAQHFGDTNDEIVREFRHEAAVLNMFGHHPNIVPFVGASTDLTQPLALVTEYVPDGSLESKLGGPTQLLSLG